MQKLASVIISEAFSALFEVGPQLGQDSFTHFITCTSASQRTISMWSLMYTIYYIGSIAFDRSATIQDHNTSPVMKIETSIDSFINFHQYSSPKCVL